MVKLDDNSISKMNLDTNHPNVIDRDWRMQYIAAFVEDGQSPTGVIHKAGEQYLSVGLLKYQKRKSLIFMPLPNPSAIYLSLAHKAQTQAEEIISFLNKYLLDEEVSIIPKENEVDLFNAFECLISSIINSYTATESFANASIPNDYHFERIRKDKKCLEIYSKDQIERYLNLSIKLDEILPKIYAVPTPKGGRLWSNFVWLEELRDRFIHLKSSDWEQTDNVNVDEFVWTNLLSNKTMFAPLFALELIEYYFQVDKPRWLRKASLEIGK